MTKEELEKATGQELIEQRDYCGVDGYYGDYLDNVNAEMLKRFNRLAELEKENAELKETVTKMNNVITETFRNLSKAKELLERLLITSCNSDVLNLLPNCSEVLRVRVEAEQFISEVEK